MLHSKFGANWSNRLGRVIAKWAWPTPRNLAVMREHVDVRYNIVRQIMWELWAKNYFTC